MKNLAPFHPCHPENLIEVEYRQKELIYLEENVLRQESIQAVPWLLLPLLAPVSL